MNTDTFEMVAKTFQGLEDVLAGELTALGAQNVSVGRRMVAFSGDLAMLYKANLCCRTALRILKPIYKFTANDTDTLYEMTKEFDWGSLLSPDKTFSVDPVVNSDIFTNSRFVTYRVKDAIVDWFKDRLGPDVRPGVRLQDADVMINVHIDGNRVTLSLDSSGESLHRRGYRVAQNDAPINEVLAAGIIMLSGWKGDRPLVDPMCGSGTFLIEAALIAANINPGVYRSGFAFEHWADFDRELFESLYNDDSAERDIVVPIIGADISRQAIDISRRNALQAGVAKHITLEVKPLSQWVEAPEGGMMVTNPPYGQRLRLEDLDGLYATIGNKLKNVFKGYTAWIIGYQDDTFRHIGLAPSQKTPLYNGSLECSLREYVIFDGDYKSFRAQGGSLHKGGDRDAESAGKEKRQRRPTDEEWRRDARKKGFGCKNCDWKGTPGKKGDRKFGDRKFGDKSFKKFSGKEDRRRDDATQAEQPNENPLAVRRNEYALRSITGRKPSLPTNMKHRGWRKNPDSE